MREKDLFYYLFENDDKLYYEILNLIELNEDMTDKIITEGQKLFLRDFYFRLLFRIAVLSYRGYTNTEIVRMLNINEDIKIITEDNLKKLMNKYKIVLQRFYEIIEKNYKSVTIKKT